MITGSDDNNEFKTAPDEATGKEGSAISGGKSGSGSQGGKEDSKLNASQKQQSAPGSTPDSKSAGSQSQNNLKPMSDDITKTGSDQKTVSFFRDPYVFLRIDTSFPLGVGFSRFK